MAVEPTSGVKAFHEAYELIFEAHAKPADVFDNDTQWAMFLSGKVNAAISYMRTARAALATPAASPATEPVAWMQYVCGDIRLSREEWKDQGAFPVYTHPPASPSPAPAAVEELAQRLRDTAHGIEAGNVADPHGRKVGLLREAATALSTLAADKARIEAERDAALNAFASGAYLDACKGGGDIYQHSLALTVEKFRDAEARASVLEGALVKIERLGSDGEHSGDRHAQCRAIAQSALAASQGER